MSAAVGLGESGASSARSRRSMRPTSVSALRPVSAICEKVSAAGVPVAESAPMLAWMTMLLIECARTSWSSRAIRTRSVAIASRRTRSCSRSWATA